MTTFKSQQRSAAINQSEFAFILSSYLTLLIPPSPPPPPPHVECCVLCFNLMAEGGKKVTVFQESWRSCLQTLSHCRHSAQGSVKDGVVSCHRCVFILNTLTGWRSNKCKKKEKKKKKNQICQRYVAQCLAFCVTCQISEIPITLRFSDTSWTVAGGAEGLINMLLKTENRKPLKLAVKKISALPQDEWGFLP